MANERLAAVGATATSNTNKTQTPAVRRCMTDARCILPRSYTDSLPSDTIVSSFCVSSHSEMSLVKDDCPAGRECHKVSYKSRETPQNREEKVNREGKWLAPACSNCLILLHFSLPARFRKFRHSATNQKAGSSNLSGRSTSPRIR